MAIRLEFLNLIVPVHVIDRKYPGGWKQCRTDHGLEEQPSSFGACWHDGLLFRDGAMSPFDMAMLKAKWEAIGFKAIRCRRGRSVVADFCVYPSPASPASPVPACTWLSIDTSVAMASFRGSAFLHSDQHGRLFDMSINEIAENLSCIAKRIGAQRVQELERLKLEHRSLQREDFLWHFLLQSFATMGRSSGWRGLIGERSNYDQVTFEALSRLDDADRERTVRAVCRKAKIRMPDKKADFILGCFRLIRDMGGLNEAKSRLLAQEGRDGKIKFLLQFPGIGPKYARNIMMDVYHEDFRDSIAVDARIKSISEALGVSFKSYQEHEAFFLEVARLAGLNGWELDRLMYHFKDDFEREIFSSVAARAATVPTA